MKFIKFITIVIIGVIAVYGYYAFFYNRSNNGDIHIKYSTETATLYGKEVMEYMEDNGFRFMSGNPIYATNFTFVDDGVDFKRYIEDDDSIKYMYCNTNIYPICANVDISINELSTMYDTTSSDYERLVSLYNDYKIKLSQLNLTTNQIKSALDYHYHELYD